MSIQQLQQALTQMRTNGASDLEIQSLIERFKNNATAKQNNFKKQFAAQVAQPISLGLSSKSRSTPKIQDKEIGELHTDLEGLKKTVKKHLVSGHHSTT